MAQARTAIPPEGDGAGLYRGWRLEFTPESKRLPWVATGRHKRVSSYGKIMIVPGDVLRATTLDRLIARIDAEEAKGSLQ